MDTFDTPHALVRSRKPDRPVALARPQQLIRAASWFSNNFPGRTLYAVKANPSAWVIDTLVGAGVDGFDVSSEREIAMIAGRAPSAMIAYLHPVKSRKAIARAYHEFGCRIFAFDCDDELTKIVAETGGANDLTLVARLIVNDAASKMPLGGKFGARPDEFPALLRAARPYARALGVTFHVGSQCMVPKSFRGAMKTASEAIAHAGVAVDVVDVGGGFPAPYPGLTPPPLRNYGDEISAAFDDMNLAGAAELWCEPGRALAAEAVSILARIDLRKGDALYLNDGAFGNLFDAAHVRWPFPVRLIRADGEVAGEAAPFRFFGPTCDACDAMPGPFHLPSDAREGDYVEIGMLGAYGTSLSTRFNGFGDTDTVVVRDNPWASAFDGNAATPGVTVPA